ncbi:MAG: DUF5820 family protein [Halobaculum sp.]
MTDATGEFPADRLPDGWRVWSQERDGRVVLAFRPGTFDGSDYPAECLPTIYLSNGSRRRRPGAGGRTTDAWHVTLYLEPDVDCGTDRYDDRAAAIDGAVALAERFAHGEIDYRDAYQLPREAYFDALDRLTGE